MVRRFIPSPALVVASLALALCVGGASYAAAKITTKDIANDAIISVKVKDGSLQPADLGPAVAREMQVRAYASVVVSPHYALDPARTKGFVSVKRAATGVYCLTLSDGISAARSAPVVTVDWDNSSGPNLTAYLSKSAFECPDGSDLGVRTFTSRAGKPYHPANTVAFTLVVP